MRPCIHSPSDLLPDTAQVALSRRKFPEATSLLNDLSARLDSWSPADGNLSDLVAAHAQRVIDEEEAEAREARWRAEERARLSRERAKQAKVDAAKAKLAMAARAKQEAEDARAAADAIKEAEEAEAAAKLAAAAEAEAQHRAATAEYTSVVQAHTFTVDAAWLPPPLAPADGEAERIALAEQLVLLLEKLLQEAEPQGWAPSHVLLKLGEALVQRIVAQSVRDDGGDLGDAEVRPEPVATAMFDICQSNWPECMSAIICACPMRVLSEMVS